MDEVTFIISLVLMMLAVQYGQGWLMFGILGVMIIYMRSLKVTVLLLLSAGVLYVLGPEGLKAYWPFVLFGLIILALLFGFKSQGEGAEVYPGGAYGDLLGGGGGGLGGGY